MREEEPLQRVLLRDGQRQVDRRQEAEEAVPLRALPAGLRSAALLPGALPGAPAAPRGGGHAGLQGSGSAAAAVTF